MEIAFYYAVRAKLIKKVNDKDLEFLEFETLFEDEKPIAARKKAINHYQSYIDVLINKDNASDREARQKLKPFISTDLISKLNIGDEEVDLNESFGIGIGVFMIINKPINRYPNTGLGEFLEEHPDKELFIHGIGNLSYMGNNPTDNMRELESELEYYKYYGFDTNKDEILINFCDSIEWEEGYLGNGNWIDDSYKEPRTRTILVTPFDWTGFDKPYWWGEPSSDKEEIELIPATVEEIISTGESNQVEFKPSLIYNFLTRKAGIGIKGIIAKTICAFLNSNGGILFIGVSDNGMIQGLDYDFDLSEGKNPKDFFRLEFDQMLEHFMSFSVKSNVTGQFFSIDGKEIFAVFVTPMKRRPVFLKGQNNKEFYVRGEASSRQLIDIEDIVNYCIDKWSN